MYPSKLVAMKSDNFRIALYLLLSVLFVGVVFQPDRQRLAV
jgi:hypothetical protein